MVKFHYIGGSKTHSFVYETTTDKKMEDVCKEIIHTHNEIFRVRRLANAVRQLAKYGPMKPPEKQGFTPEEIDKLAESRKKEGKEEGGSASHIDPLGLRTGNAPDQKLQETLNRVADEADAAVSHNLATRRKPITEASIKTACDNIRGAVMMAYPMKLPDYDQVTLIQKGEEEIGVNGDPYFETDSALLWFANRVLPRTGSVAQAIRSENERMTVKIKLTAKGGSAPQRESGVNEETHKKMMAMWHKKKKTSEQLEKDEESQYLNSSWANPKAYKEAMHGLRSIKFR